MIHEAVLDAFSLLLPVVCAGCGAEDRSCCAICGYSFVPGLLRKRAPDGSSVVSALRYEGVVRQSLLQLKENGRTDIAVRFGPPFGAAIAAAIADAAAGPLELLAMPVGRLAYRRRGYDPVRLLLRAAGHDAERGLLRASRRRGEQKTLGREARAANLDGSLTAAAAVIGRRFLLVDDVITTGATLAEAARALRAAGAEVVGAATLASTPKLYVDSHEPPGLTRDIPSARV